MAKKQRRNHGAGFKAKVALEAMKEEETRHCPHSSLLQYQEDSC